MFIEYRPHGDDPHTVRVALPGHAGQCIVDLGDGATAVVADGIVTHRYPGPGVYQVSAVDALGRSAAADITIAVPGSTAPADEVTVTAPGSTAPADEVTVAAPGSTAPAVVVEPGSGGPSSPARTRRRVR